MNNLLQNMVKLRIIDPSLGLYICGSVVYQPFYCLQNKLVVPQLFDYSHIDGQMIWQKAVMRKFSRFIWIIGSENDAQYLMIVHENSLKLLYLVILWCFLNLDIQLSRLLSCSISLEVLKTLQKITSSSYIPISSLVGSHILYINISLLCRT